MDKMKMFKGVSDAELVKMFAQGREIALSELVARYFDQARKNAMYVVKDSAEAELMVSDAFMTVSKSIRNGAYTEQGDFRAYLMQTVRFKAMDYYRKNVKQVSNDCDSDAYSEYQSAIIQATSLKRSGLAMDFNDASNESILRDEAETEIADAAERDEAEQDNRSRTAAEKREMRLTLIEQAVCSLPEMQRDIFCLRQSGVLYAEWKTLQEANDPSLAGREGVKFADIVTILGLKSVNTATSGYQYALKNIKKAIAAKMCAAA